METLDKQNDIVLQKDALKIYLDALLCVPESSAFSQNEASDSQPTIPELIFNAVLAEINQAEERIKAPRWATEYFSCLPITVADVTLLLPLRHVRTVIPLAEDIQFIEDAPDWILGNMVNGKKTIKVVDTRQVAYQRLTMPEEETSQSQLVVITDGKWGLSCDAVGKVQQLNRNEVNWRAKDSKRRWISGLSMKQRLAIVDVKRIEFAMALERSLV